MRFNNTNHRSLNESITKVQNPQVALDEALEYTAMLEAVILDICEELEIDPDALVEDAFTLGRVKEHRKAIKSAKAARDKSYKKDKDAAQRLGEPRSSVHGDGGSQTRGLTRKLDAVRRKAEIEGRSEKIYGKGGKIRGTTKTGVKGKGDTDWDYGQNTDRYKFQAHDLQPANPHRLASARRRIARDRLESARRRRASARRRRY